MSRQTLYEIVSSRINENEDLNCAETVVYAANRAYELGLPHSALKLAAGCLPVLIVASRILQEIIDRELSKGE